MSYNPHITAARREAKKHARITGTSHQTALEEIARQSGADSWADFLNNPRPIAADFSQNDCAQSGKMTPEQAQKSRWLQPRMTIALVILSLCVIGGYLMYSAWEWQLRNQGQNTIYNEERTLVAKGFLPDIINYRDAYITATKTGEDTLSVYLTYFDWRQSGNSFFFSDLISDIKEKLGSYPGLKKRYREHPVARLQGKMNCKTNEIIIFGYYLADDLISPEAKQIAGGETLLLLPKEQADIICAQEVLTRTKELKERGEIGRPDGVHPAPI